MATANADGSAKARIAVLVSGGGTNLQALIDAEKSGKLRSGSICLVISNKKDAFALQRAANAGIEALAITRKSCGGQEGFEKRLIQEIDDRNIDLIVMAGFMSILSEDFTRHFDHKIINTLCERDSRRWRDHHAEGCRSQGRRYAGSAPETRDGRSGMDHTAGGGREDMR